ncbi:MAG: hypothetical protein C4520_03060 [Candidatus Abyssobacteria bacterium SURF_5]|uniref:Uncharacterized protein n=1 Tax=Abyssobacteria bacterium (strain SURF_5) TaxID=2093360 RepID=A0A3A4PAI5_ABYX5|nr:MAG: hypothetical protein C4520_03060 [Candidatus Abyssubacteria bacterium SURF_5]
MPEFLFLLFHLARWRRPWIPAPDRGPGQALKLAGLTLKDSFQEKLTALACGALDLHAVFKREWNRSESMWVEASRTLFNREGAKDAEKGIIPKEILILPSSLRPLVCQEKPG